MGTGIALHVLADRLDNAQIDRIVTHVQRVQMPYINITGGARIDVAMQLIERLAATSPNTLPVFRQGDDDGLWKIKSVDQWYQERIAPRRDWLRKNHVIFMPDNESLEGDLRPYALWMTQAITKCAADGIRVAAGRFATGNPGENQYAQLDLMWHALNDFGGVWSPNEYMGLTPQLSGGHLNRYFEHGWKRCKELELASPVTVIGESGLCGSTGANLDPYTGYHKLGISDADYASRYVIPTYEAWYKPNGVTVCVFSYGNWDNHGFDVGEDYLKAIEAYAQQKVVEVKTATKPMPISKPANPGAPSKVIVTFKSPIRNLRDGYGADYRDIGDIQQGETITVYNDAPFYDANGGRWVWVENTSAGAGWMKTDNVTFTNVPTKPLPPPPVASPAPDVLPVMQTYIIPMMITVKATSKEAAEEAATAAMMAARNNWQLLIASSKLRTYLDTKAIADAQFVIQLD